MNRRAFTTAVEIASLASGPLGEALARARWLHSVNTRLARQLDEPLRLHVRLANVSGDRALFHASSPAWATRLRYQSGRILETLQRMPDLEHLQSVHVRVQAPQPRISTTAPNTRKRMTESASAHIASVADSTDHPELGRVLRRLAGRCSDSSSG